MKKVILNDLIKNGDFGLGLMAGMTKSQIESILNKGLYKPIIETPDVDCYEIILNTGLSLILLLDKNQMCFEIKLNLEENKDVKLMIVLDDLNHELTESMSINSLIELLYKLRVSWNFDKTRTYLQTVCIKLENNLRLYYAFGDVQENDYGFFLISSLI